jgi:hypothetical protein
MLCTDDPTIREVHSIRNELVGVAIVSASPTTPNVNISQYKYGLVRSR